MLSVKIPIISQHSEYKFPHLCIHKTRVIDKTSTSTYQIIALFFPSQGGCVGETSFHSMIPTPRPVQRSDCFHILHFSLAKSNKQKQLAHQLYLRWSSTDTTNHQSWTDHSKLDYSQSIMHSVLLFADVWHKCEVLWSRTDIFSFVVTVCFDNNGTL